MTWRQKQKVKACNRMIWQQKLMESKQYHMERMWK
ncbi:hypothetical protein AWRI1631_46400 [Saccharomyces cerevisiae AWRI1631]|uniref:Uncharacterized protein n=1 Tax=Saccharomyces cerevisiae (strain AWRI1631) TaxID=545124 RepID=B5VGV3_YEAS6|nr:hypothetical protein AWRI1631_46400 [Saccharomyces cerevisiae AWRI1631]